MPALPVLRDIDFTIRRGSSLGVIGESGSGKSTLARVIAGLLPAARGQVMLDGASLPPALAQRTPAQLAKKEPPDLILCDEVTSALDTIVGAAILDLMDGLRRELGLSTMFISHDLHTVRSVCDEVMVLYAGERVEAGSRRAIQEAPWHPYTNLLISSVPELRQGWLERRGSVRGPEAAAGARPACAFFTRCGLAMPGLCDVTPPPRRTLAKGAEILCHRDEAALMQAAIPAGP